MPTPPPHLSPAAAEEWDRVAGTLHGMGVLSVVDRAGLAACCQAYGRWAEAEEKLRETPTLVKTASGYVQQSPWLTVANKQLELMGRFMAEFGMTPASRSRVAAMDPEPVEIRVTYVSQDSAREKLADFLDAHATEPARDGPAE